MKRFITKSGLILSLALTLASCGDDTNLRANNVAPPNINGLPQTSIAQSDSTTLRLLAMGMSVTRAWDVKSNNRDRFTATRTISATEANSLNASLQPGEQGLLEVTNYFLPSNNGTIVASRAEIKIKDASGQTRSVDITQAYQAALKKSHENLKQGWQKNRARLAQATPNFQDKASQEKYLEKDPVSTSATNTNSNNPGNTQVTPATFNEEPAQPATSSINVPVLDASY